MGDGLQPIPIMVLLVALGLAPFVLLLVTSFVKIVVVFSLMRNALGIQNAPPNIVLNGMALILTVYIMAPTLEQAMDAVVDSNPDVGNIQSLKTTLGSASEPFRDFMAKHTTSEHRQLFIRTAGRVWPEEKAATARETDFFILIPSFLTSELARAFEISFLLFIPFLVVDMVVAALLLSMGMMMMSPIIVSLPVKLLLFVLLNGWSRLLEGLVLTYS